MTTDSQHPTKSSRQTNDSRLTHAEDQQPATNTLSPQYRKPLLTVKCHPLHPAIAPTSLHH